MRTLHVLISVALFAPLGLAQTASTIPGVEDQPQAEMIDATTAASTQTQLPGQSGSIEAFSSQFIAGSKTVTGPVLSPDASTPSETAGHLNGAYYLADCSAASPASWCAGSDVGAWINAAMANCPSLYLGYRSCNIVLPESNNGVWSTPAVINSPGISLFGYGSHDSIFNCSVVNGACLMIRDSRPFTTDKGGRVQGFRINGNSGANAFGIEIVDYQGLTMQDVVTANFTGSGGTGFYWYAISDWIEDSNVLGLDAINNTVDYRLGSSKTHASFGYNTFINLHCYISTGQTCFSVEGTADAYNGMYALWVNKAGKSENAVAVNVQDTASVSNGTFLLNGEDQDSRVDGYLFHITSQATFSTNYQVFWAGYHTPSSIAGKWNLLATNWSWAPGRANLQYQPWQMTRNEGGTLLCPYLPPSACSLDLQGYAQFGRDSTGGVYMNTENGGQASGLMRFHIDTAGHVTFPNTTSVTGPNIPLIGTLTTTAASSDNVAISGVTASSHCWVQPTDAGAASGIASVYVSARTTNQITVNHAATAGWTFDVFCTPN